MVAMFSLSTVLSLLFFVRASVLLQQIKRIARIAFYIVPAETFPIAATTQPEVEDAF
jgi:hypothetical protein